MSEFAAALVAKLHTARQRLPQLLPAFRLVWDAAPRLTLVWALLLALQGVLPVATVQLTRSVVNNLVSAGGHAATWSALLPVLLPVLAMAAVLLAGEMLHSLSNWVRLTQAEQVRDHVMSLIHAQAMAVDFAFYESPDYYDLLYRAHTDAQSRPLILLENAGNLLQSTITLMAMGAVLIPFGLWLPVALVVSTLPALLVVVRYALREHAWRQRTTPDERRAWYYDWLLTTRENAAEMRLFDLGGHFSGLFQALRARLRSERSALAREQGVAELLAGGAALSITGLAMVWMVRRVGRGEVSLGDLALFYQAFNQGQGLMRQMLESVGQIYANSLFLGYLFSFLNLKRSILAPAVPASVPQPMREGIRFEDVTFRYPGSQTCALEHFSLFIPAGSVTAIVGTNGAGKSTLVKLMCRLFEPDAGRITIDGVNLAMFDPEVLLRRISVLLQEPVYFNATFSQNVAFGDLRADAGPELIRAAAEGAGADQIARHLPHGYDTQLGKWFSGGVDLSVGEWQRVALARAFLRQAELLFLDEPTSAMDSWAETDWLGRLHTLATGRTAVIITHRFTTAMRADLIYVLDDGHVVESGSHAELLAQGGRYALSWAAQMADVLPTAAGGQAQQGRPGAHAEQASGDGREADQAPRDGREAGQASPVESKADRG